MKDIFEGHQNLAYEHDEAKPTDQNSVRMQSINLMRTRNKSNNENEE